jgi:hypothetical protein
MSKKGSHSTEDFDGENAKEMTSPVQKKKDGFRVHLALTEKSVVALDVLQDRLEASTTSEAVRRAILLALKITDSIEAGGQVVVEKPDGRREVLLIG